MLYNYLAMEKNIALVTGSLVVWALAFQEMPAWFVNRLGGCRIENDGQSHG